MIALYKIGLSIAVGVGAAFLIEGKNGNEKHGENCRDSSSGNGGVKPRSTSPRGNRRSRVTDERIPENRNDHAGDGGTGKQRAATPRGNQAERVTGDELDAENGNDSGGGITGSKPVAATSVVSDGNEQSHVADDE